MTIRQTAETAGAQAQAMQDAAPWLGQKICLRFRDLPQVNATHSIRYSPDLSAFAPDDVMMEGRVLNRELRPGLHLHVAEVEEQHALVSRSEHQPGLYCIFLLSGALDLRFGEHGIGIGGPNGAMKGISVLHHQPELFERLAKGRQSVRKVIISASPEWLSQEGAGFLAALPPGMAAGGITRWDVSPRLVDLISQIMRPPGVPAALVPLYFESRAIEVVYETLTAMLRSTETIPRAALTPGNLGALERAKLFIESAVPEDLKVAMIARNAGVSASVLQRLFQSAENCSVFEYVRRFQLDRAHVELRGGCSIPEASRIAGYTLAANFSTAFRARFGITPRSLQQSLRKVWQN